LHKARSVSTLDVELRIHPNGLELPAVLVRG
jgi:hypothetical protein